MRNYYLFFLLLLVVSCKSDKSNEIKPELVDLNGASPEVYLKDKTFKIAIVNYFATYCSPCKKEMPGLQSIYDEYKNRGVILIGVTTEKTETMPVIEKIARLLKVTYPLLYNGSSVINGETVSVLPDTYVFDSNMNVIKRFTGLLTEVTLKELLDTQLKTSESAASAFSPAAQAKLYTIRALRNGKNVDLSVTAAPGYKLGGSEYPPATFSLPNKVTGGKNVYKFVYSKGAYTVTLPYGTTANQIEGHITAFICSDTTCIPINEDVSVKVE